MLRHLYPLERGIWQCGIPDATNCWHFVLFLLQPLVKMKRQILLMLFVLAGCCCSTYFLELMVKWDSGSVNLLTFASFAFVATEGFVVTSRCGRVKPVVPMRAWVQLVLLYFVVSVINNWALNFNISMPLHMIFKSGSLMANMLTSMVFLKRQYSLSKKLSVLCITVGVAMCTIASGKEVACCSESPLSQSLFTSIGITEWGRWMLGICMMTVSLFLAAQMGVYQEHIYRTYGNYPREALFYTHLLPLPGFVLLSSDIWHHFQLAAASDPMDLIVAAVPSAFVFMTGYVVTQFLCILSVFQLTSACSSLTVTLVLTLRKFLSLLFSIVYFNNPFTSMHVAGTALVFAGTLFFSDVPFQLMAKKSDLKSE